MRETPEDLARLQSLLDRSYDAAGRYLREVITPERRLSAEDLAARLTGMCLLVVATATADGRPIIGPVDGIFYRGSWYFGSSPDSVRLRHIGRGSAVSVTHAPAEEFSVTVHGRATEVDYRAVDDGGFRQALLDIYVPRFGPEWERFIEAGAATYVRIEAERMYTFYLDPESMASA